VAAAVAQLVYSTQEMDLVAANGTHLSNNQRAGNEQAEALR